METKTANCSPSYPKPSYPKPSYPSLFVQAFLSCLHSKRAAGAWSCRPGQLHIFILSWGAEFSLYSSFALTGKLPA